MAAYDGYLPQDVVDNPNHPLWKLADNEGWTVEDTFYSVSTNAPVNEPEMEMG